MSPRYAALTRRTPMRFLYRRSADLLENICAGPYLCRRRMVGDHVVPPFGAARLLLRCAGAARSIPRRSASMLDLVLLALGLAFFVLSVGYAHVCDRL